MGLVYIVVLGLVGLGSGSDSSLQRSDWHAGVAFAGSVCIPQRLRPIPSNCAVQSTRSKLCTQRAQRHLGIHSYLTGMQLCAKSTQSQPGLGGLGLEDMQAFVKEVGVAAEFVSIARNLDAEFLTARATAGL